MEKLGEKIMLCKNLKTLIIQCKIIKGIRLFLDLDENKQQTFSNVAHYRVSSKTVPTWLFALLSASTHANCKSWDVFEKFKKFATK